MSQALPENLQKEVDAMRAQVRMMESPLSIELHVENLRSAIQNVRYWTEEHRQIEAAGQDVMARALRIAQEYDLTTLSTSSAEKRNHQQRLADLSEAIDRFAESLANARANAAGRILGIL